MRVKLFSFLLAASCLLGAFVPAVSAGDTLMLSGKRVLCVGDSLTYGYGEGGKLAWASRLQSRYGMVATNAGINGATLSDQRAEPAGNRRVIYDGLERNKNTAFDYVLLQGGINDATGHDKVEPKHQPVEVGTVAKTYELSDFDVDTFAGGLERLFYYATAYYPDARIGYIITYKAPYSGYGGDSTNAGRFWEIARVICDKWNIDYLDLHDGTTSQGGTMRFSEDVLRSTDYNTPYLVRDSDYLHLNAAGYDVLTPHIAGWMTSLQPYGDVPDSYTPTKPTTTTTTTTVAVTTTTTTSARTSVTASGVTTSIHPTTTSTVANATTTQTTGNEITTSGVTTTTEATIPAPESSDTDLTVTEEAKPGGLPSIILVICLIAVGAAAVSAALIWLYVKNHK